MSPKVQILRSLVEQRLTAAAEEIFGLFERTIAEYEEELCRTKEENQRQRQILESVWNPRVLIHKTDIQQVKEEVPPEQQEWTSIVVLEEPQPQPPHIKEEQEELWTSQEVSITKFPSTPVPVKHEDDDELNQTQTVENKVEANTMDCGGSEPASSFHPHRHLQRKNDGKNEDSEETEDQEEPEPEPPHIKEEQEELWTSQEVSITKFPSTPFLVKSEDGDELNQTQTVENKVEANEDDCGGSEPASSFHPHRHLQTTTNEQNEDCEETEDNNEDQILNHKPESKLPTNSSTEQMETETDGDDGGGSDLKSHLEIHMGEKPFCCSIGGSGFKHKSSLCSHIPSHTREKPFRCSLCDKCFTERSEVRRHIRIHTRERPFSCSECSQGFTYNIDLQRHMRIHTGERPFSCVVCQKRFRRKHHLQTHMKIHMRD